MTEQNGPSTNGTETGGYSTAISGKGTRMLDDRDPVAGVYSNGKLGDGHVRVLFIPRARISTEMPDDKANWLSTWCDERGGEGVFGVQYSRAGGTYEDRGVYVFESVVGQRTSVRLLYFDSTDPEVNQQSSNLWRGRFRESVVHVEDGEVTAGTERYSRV